MTHLLVLYPIVKASENLSIRLGYGRFPLGADGWKCVTCHSPHSTKSEDTDLEIYIAENETLCRDCKISWVREVGHIEYSDAFERIVGIWAGAAFLVFGVCSMLLNESTNMGVWKEGEALHWLNTHLTAPLHIFHYLDQIYNLLLITLLITAYLTLLTTMSIITFLLCMDPGSKRHWRNMTLPMYGLLVGEVVYGVILFHVGISPWDLVLVFGPIYLGFASIVGALNCTRVEMEGEMRLD